MPVTDEVFTRKMKFFEKIGYKPHKASEELHKDSHRIMQVAGGERYGKSKFAAAEGCARMFVEDMLAGYPSDEYWLVAADYSRTRAEWEYLGGYFKALGFLKSMSKRVDPGEMIVGFKGVAEKSCIRIYTKSSSDPLKLAATAPRGIIGCEASQLDYETFLRCIGRLAEKRGWMILTGTFETSLGWYAEKFKYWQSENVDDARSYSKPTWENKVIFPKGRNDPEIIRLEGQMSRERFMERHGGVPCPPAGSVFANYFSNGTHVRDDLCFFNPDEEVFIWVDPGYTHANVVEAVQIRDGRAFIIDEIYSMGLVTGGDTGVINAFKQKPWAKNVRRGTVDVAGTQKRPEGPPIVEVWRKEAGVELTSNKVGILEGIEVFKTFLMPNPITNEPKIYINSKCRGLISEMGGCVNPITGRPEVWSFQVDKEGKIVGDKPKPINDDACKAIIYGLVDTFGYAAYKPMKRTRGVSPYRLVTV